MLGPVDVGRPQVRHQELLAAGNVQGQEAVVVVIAVEEAAFLIAVHGVVGGVEVQHQFLGRRGVGGDERLHQRLGHPD